MSEEDKTKPKAKLIKHQKTEPSSNTEGNQEPEKKEKKKVVVVKKKVVVKKPRVVAVKSDSKESETKDESAKKQPNDSESRSRNNDRPKKYTPSRTSGGYQDRNRNSSGPRSSSSPGRNQSPGGRSNFRSGGNTGGGRPQNTGNRRPGSPPSTGRPTGGQRPSGGGYQGRKPGGPPSRNNSSGGTPPANDFANKNSGGKKFYKTKKKDYHKKKHEEHEKAYQYKKKSISTANPIPKEIDIMEVITVSDLARKMNLKASDLISKLMSMGMMVTINQQIDADTATLLADEYNCKVKIVSLYDETIIETVEDKEEDLEDRPAIITVMGHVDHGKTKLLDAIRESDVVSEEHGGITQHIGAYTVNSSHGPLTFLDTPGHAAFTMMRARGAHVTDIVVLVVAAGEGVMPQTVEAINHAKEGKVPIIVAVNKMDLPEANPDRIMQQLSEYNLVPEEWGGNTQFIKISALKKQGLDTLLETIALESEMLELKANWKCPAEGKVIESKVDQGRGIVSTVLVQKGVLKIGDSFVAGIYPGKVRAMFNDKGQKVKEATPSMPVEILGFSGIPNSGDPFQVTESDRVARQYGVKRQELKKVEEAKNVKKITLDNLYDSIQEGEVLELKVIIKGDVHGSVEALQSALEKLSTNEIRLTCIHAAAGAIVESDVSMASASNAIIVGFHVRPTPKALGLAEKDKVEIRKYNVIYDAVEDIRSAMEGMLAPDLKEEVVGTVQVRETFKVPKIGTIAGCMVTSGKVTRKSQVHVIRDNVEVFTGSISSLKRFKDDVKEVASGYECGLSIDNFADIQIGDELEVFEMKEISKKLKEN